MLNRKVPEVIFKNRIRDESISGNNPYRWQNISSEKYFNEKKLTEQLIWKDKRGKSFIKSGDIGKLDEEGFLTILDRKKDMIISGGLNVFPVDIEEIVGKHPDILDGTVIGIPDEKWGETCLALVIPKSEKNIDTEELKERQKKDRVKSINMHLQKMVVAS